MKKRTPHESRIRIFELACLRCLKERGSLRNLIDNDYWIDQEIYQCYKLGVTYQEVGDAIVSAKKIYEQWKKRHKKNKKNRHKKI